MVNTLSHLGVGLLIALALGFKGKKRNVLAFLSILPDLDFIPYMLFVLVSGSVSHETQKPAFLPVWPQRVHALDPFHRACHASDLA